MKKFTKTEERILNRIQRDWKITETPFKELAAELNINEEELIRIMNKLKQKKIIRDISAIFNAANLGYESALIAFEILKEDIEKTVSIINEHPGVSHNYLRDHRYNIWFTLAVNRKSSIEKEAAILAEKSNAKDFLILKNERLYKIGVMLHIGGDDDNTESYTSIFNKENITENTARELSEEEKKSVYILQMDLPLENRPFKRLIEKFNLDIDEKSVVRTGEIFKKEKIMRRYGAILKHNKAGYSFNAMTAWKLKNHNDSNVIKLFSSIPNISHLYFRTIYPGKWDYGLFAMIHARNKEELKAIIKMLENQSGIKDYLSLHSLKEFKKERVKYFTDGFS